MTATVGSLAQRRHRLARRHHLAIPAPSIEAVADDLVVLHATDPATIYLAISARSPEATIDDIDDALFVRRSLRRTLAMRRTLFVATTEHTPMVERSSSVDVAAAERRRLEGFLADSGIDEPGRWLAEVFDSVLAALDVSGPDGADGLAARELTAAVPKLGTKIVLAGGTKHAQTAGATSRVLGLMAVEGHIVRGRPSGGWTTRQYRWHRRDHWPPDPASAPADAEAASIALLAAWLGRFGPASIDDMKWWTGWTKTKTKGALAAIETAEVALDGQGLVGHVLAGDRREVPPCDPWARLLPALDPTAMGWKDRDWYLGPHRAELFDRNGNIGPTVWVDGRIVGGWSQRPDGEVVVELLEPVDGTQRDLIDQDVERVTRFVGSTVVKPSFPTPLQKRLSAGEP